MTDLEEATGGAGDAPESLWRRPAVRAGVAAIVVSLAMNVPAARSVLEELGVELGALGLVAIGAWMAGRLGDRPEALWGRRSVGAGVVAIVVSLVMGAPFLGGGVLGELRFVLTNLGLVAIGSGMAAMLWQHPWHAPGKTAVVVATVFAIGALVLSGVDQVPVRPERCASAEALTLEKPGPVYCHESDGTLVRMSISNVRQCPDGSVIWDVTKYRRWRSGWETHGPGTGCPL